MAALMTTLSCPEESQDPIIELLRNYEELNGSTITELEANPSALEFMRYVAQNRPFVVRGGADDWEALRSWNVNFLKTALRGEKVNVAMTPSG
jgi:jumonji domain-containing protein 7